MHMEVTSNVSKGFADDYEEEEDFGKRDAGGSTSSVSHKSFSFHPQISFCPLCLCDFFLFLTVIFAFFAWYLAELTVRVDRESNSDQKTATPRSKHSVTEQRRRSKINERWF